MKSFIAQQHNKMLIKNLPTRKKIANTDGFIQQNMLLQRLMTKWRKTIALTSEFCNKATDQLAAIIFEICQRALDAVKTTTASRADTLTIGLICVSCFVVTPDDDDDG